MKTIEVKLLVVHDKIADVLYSCPQGSSYWAGGALDRLGYEKDVTALLDGTKSITIVDHEDDDKVHTLNYDKIVEGLQWMVEKYPKHFADLLDDYDATTSDVLLQCALFNDVIYG